MRIPLLDAIRGPRDRSDSERDFVAVETVAGTRDDPGSGGSSGRDGTGTWFADVIEGGPDVNPELTGRAKFEIYREMKLTDAAVKSLLWMYRLPIRQADWSVIPSKRDPHGDAIAKARADWLSAVVGLEEHDAPRMLHSWDEWLQQTLQFFEWGSMGEELVWNPDLVPWTDADGDVHLLREPLRMAPRYPATIIGVDRDRATGVINSVLQDLPDARPIPGRKLAWYVTEREGESIFGTSMLRACYGPYRLKRALIVSAAINWDRYAAKLPVVRHPMGDKAKKKAEAIGENIRSHERAFVALEGPEPQFGGQWDVTLLGSDNLSEPVNLLRFYNQEISSSGLQQFKDLGTSSHGSRAVGDTLSDPFYMAVTAFASYVATERGRQFTRRLWDVNFGRDVPIPSITVQKIQGRNVMTLARALADLATAGLTFTDRDTQNDLRDILDLRHLPELQATVDGLPPDVGITTAVPPVEGGPIAPPAVPVRVPVGA